MLQCAMVGRDTAGASAIICDNKKHPLREEVQRVSLSRRAIREEVDRLPLSVGTWEEDRPVRDF
jgi:hypothetical protein